MATTTDVDHAGLLDHGQWRPEWHSERPCAYWYLLPGSTGLEPDGLAEELAGVRDPLHEVNWLDVVPPAWWHVTVCDVGFGDELGADTAPAVAEAVAAELADLPPLELELGAVAALPSAVALEVGPLETLRHVQHAVRATTQRVVGLDRPLAHHHTYRPHLSLGYTNRRLGRREAADALSSLRDHRDAPTRLTVDRLSLVAATRNRSHYQWTVEHEVALGDTAGPPLRRRDRSRPR